MAYLASDNASAFSPDASATNTPDAQRRRKLESITGLRGLYTGSTNEQDTSDVADLQNEPLNGGRLGRSLSMPTDAGEPSALSTERVQRAPAIQEASPLLSPDQRIDNAVSEFDRGEEGSYGALAGGDRSDALRGLFGHTTPTPPEQSTNPTDNAGPDSFGQGLGYAKTATSAANTLDKATGGTVDRSLKSLYAQTAKDQARDQEQTYPGESLGVPSTSYGAGADIYPGESLGVDSNSYNTLGGTAGSTLGAGASGLGLLYSLYSLYQARGGDMSPSQLVGLIQSSGGLSSSLGSLAGVGAGEVAPIAAGGASSALGAGSGAAAGLSAAGAGLGAIGGTMGIGIALGNAINGYLSGDDRAIGGASGTLIGLAGGAVIGTLIAPGVGTLVGAGVGAGLGAWLGGYFGQNLPHYYAIREHAGDVGKDAVAKYMDGVINAGDTGGVLDVQRALGQSFADGRVRVDLNLPKDVAAAVGVDPHAKIGDIPPGQFITLLKAYSERAGTNANWFVGSGDVPYLSSEHQGGKLGGAEALASGVTAVARGAFDTMAQFFAPQLAKLPSVAPLHWENVGDYRLAPELEYQAYNQHTGEPGAGAPTWDPTTFDVIKQHALAGDLSDLYTAGGTPLATRGDAGIQGDAMYGQPYEISSPWSTPNDIFMPDQTDTAGQRTKAQGAASARAQQALDTRAAQLLDLYRTQGIENPAYVYYAGVNSGDPIAKRAWDLYQAQNPSLSQLASGY